LIAGVLFTSELSSKKQGEPELDFRVQAPLGSWAGRAESLDDYVASVKRAAQEAEKEAAAVRAKSDSR